MLKSKNKLLLIIFSFLMLTISEPSFSGAGRTAAQFLSLGGGPRAAAMGDAYTAMSGDITSIFWNPSGLAAMQECQFFTSYTDYSVLFGEAGEGLYYRLLTAGIPLKNMGFDFPNFGTISTALQLNGQGVIDIVDSSGIIRQEELGTNWAWTASYALQPISPFRLGINGKIINQKLGPYSATAHAVDGGFQFDLLNLRLYDTNKTKFNPSTFRVTLGAALRNLGVARRNRWPWIKFGTGIHFKDESQSDPLPRELSGGVLLTAEMNLRDFLPNEKNIPANSSLFRLNFAADSTAFVDKLKEDDEEGLEKEVERRFNEDNPENKTKDEIRKDIEVERGVGINAFRRENMVKGIGAEIWILEMLAVRLGYKDDPFINFETFSDKLTGGIGLRLPVSGLILFLSGPSTVESFFDKVYRNTERRIFLELDFSRVRGGGPENKYLWTGAFSFGF